MARIVAQNAIKCPFCGCTKMFVKAYVGGRWSNKRFHVSLQCSKCHVNGPEIFGAWKTNLGYFEDLPESERLELIAKATEKWNTRS